MLISRVAVLKQAWQVARVQRDVGAAGLGWARHPPHPRRGANLAFQPVSATALEK